MEVESIEVELLLVLAQFSTSLFCSLACLLHPGSRLTTESLAQSQCWTWPQICKEEQKKTGKAYVTFLRNDHQTRQNMDLKVDLWIRVRLPERCQQFVAVCACRFLQRTQDICLWILWAVDRYNNSIKSRTSQWTNIISRNWGFCLTLLEAKAVSTFLRNPKLYKVSLDDLWAGMQGAHSKTSPRITSRDGD